MDKTDASQRADIRADPVSHILAAGFQLTQLAICVLGVMVITGEYSTGMIRASLLAVPKTDADARRQIRRVRGCSR
jgi:ABC-type amino acid transport system permease subunit